MLILPLMMLLDAGASGGMQDEKCWRREVQQGHSVNVYLGDRACVELTEPRVISGIWVNRFEGSSFHEGVRTREDALTRKHSTWLSTDAQSRIPTKFRSQIRVNHVYRVTFLGRNARDMARKPLEGYGHFGMSPGLALVDEIRELEDLGPLPRN